MNGLNQSFNEWMKEVKWALKTVPTEMDEIIKYENMLLQCRASSFSNGAKSTISSNKEEDKIIHILMKIKYYTEKLKQRKIILEKHLDFEKVLTVIELYIYKNLLDSINKSEISYTLGVSRTTVYKNLQRIENKFKKHIVGES